LPERARLLSLPSPLPLTGEAALPRQPWFASGLGPPMCSRVWRSHFLFSFHKQVANKPSGGETGSGPKAGALMAVAPAPSETRSRPRSVWRGWWGKCRRRALSHLPSSP